MELGFFWGGRGLIYVFFNLTPEHPFCLLGHIIILIRINIVKNSQNQTVRNLCTEMYQFFNIEKRTCLRLKT